MKISPTKKISSVQNFDELIKDLLDKHGNIFFADIDGTTYVYKALGRKAYKSLVNNPNLSPLDLEDLICEETILYPEDFSPDNCDAGVPSELYQQILANSFLTSTEDMITLLEACREEVEQLDIQMSCIISEAFPVYDIDEIENWDMIKFCRMYAKAEWKLKNMRQLNLNSDVVDFLKSVAGGGNNEVVEEKPQQTQQPNKAPEKAQPINSGSVKVGNREMTKEEYQQYLEFQRANPQIDWGADAMFTGYDTQTASNVPTPLRMK